MGVRSKLLVHTTIGFAAAPAPLIYTCPDDETTILKTVTLWKTDTGTFEMTLEHEHPAGGNGRQVLLVTLNTQTRYARVEWWHIMQPGDKLYAPWTSTLSTAELTISGTQLEGVAD